MANICSVDFYIEFASSNDSKKFTKTFKRKTENADLLNEGVQLAENDWLFGAVIERSGKCGVSISGWVKWGLSHDTITNFTKALKKAGMISFEGSYDECGNNVFGKYEYAEGVLIETVLDDSHTVWKRLEDGEDDAWEKLEEALELDGVTTMVA